jgi:hypothetical protein
MGFLTNVELGYSNFNFDEKKETFKKILLSVLNLGNSRSTENFFHLNVVNQGAAYSIYMYGKKE